MLANTLPVRITLEEDSVEKAVRKTHALLAELLHHEQAPLALAQRCSGVSPPTPLFTALLNYRYSLAREASGATPLWEWLEVLYSEERTNYPVVMSIDDLGEGYRLIAQVQASVEPMRLCEYMSTALEHIIDALERAPYRLMRSIEVLSEAERRQVLYDWNATEMDYPKETCVHELFEAQVEKTPDAVAVMCGDESLSYRELNARANRLANHLIQLGVEPDARVAIGVERSVEMVVGLLAILKAGGAYVPLDPAYPPDRLMWMLNDSAPLALLTQESLYDRWGTVPERVAVVEVDADSDDWDQLPSFNTEPTTLALTSKHLAYVIYTSGSTGLPKGVMIEHRSLVNYICWIRQAYYGRSHGGSPTVFSISFDAGVTTMFGALVSGQPLTILPAGEEVAHICMGPARDPPYSLLKVTPSHLKLINQELRCSKADSPTEALMTGGEAMVPADIAFWQQRFPGVRLVNHFGPTETTVGCATFEITQDVSRWQSIPDRPSNWKHAAICIGLRAATSTDWGAGRTVHRRLWLGSRLSKSFGADRRALRRQPLRRTRQPHVQDRGSGPVASKRRNRLPRSSRSSGEVTRFPY